MVSSGKAAVTANTVWGSSEGEARLGQLSFAWTVRAASQPAATAPCVLMLLFGALLFVVCFVLFLLLKKFIFVFPSSFSILFSFFKTM